MAVDDGFAPAKVNLALHVTGRREDGYHLLDSLVVFAGIGDRITATPAPGLSLSVSGPFAAGIPTDESNLVLRAARLLQDRHGITSGAALRLEKNLPHAAGLGGGSSDGAATLRVLARLWNVTPVDPADPAVLTLGADVPVCLCAPRPVRMQGIGETVQPVPPLPPCALVLVNPGVALATPAVFGALTEKANPPMAAIPPGLRLPDLLAFLGQSRNDLGPPAERLAPAVTAVLARLRQTPGILFATMSGSGATCIGLTADLVAASRAAQAIAQAAPNWWVAPAPLLG
jgi:4-diphosphocytidyl-2-C-methyl-D-erythritol kinase